MRPSLSTSCLRLSQLIEIDDNLRILIVEVISDFISEFTGVAMATMMRVANVHVAMVAIATPVNKKFKKSQHPIFQI